MDPTTPQPDDVSPAPFANPRRSGVRTALIATSAVLVLGAGASAYSLGTYLSGGGAQPEDVLRSGAVAFAKIDLDPAANQKLAVYNLSKKFPALLDQAGSDDAVRDTLLKQMFDDASTDFSYEADMKPWLGDRAGVAVYPPAAGSKIPRFAVAVQFTDEAKMIASLDEDDPANADLDWTTRDGYVIVTEDAEADDLVAPNGGQALGSQPDFTHDVDALDGDQLAVAWADLGALVDLGMEPLMAELTKGMGTVPTAASLRADGMPAAMAERMAQQAADMQKQTTEQLEKFGDIDGRLAMGIRAGSDFLEMQGKVFDATGAADATAVPGTDLAGQMPADSLAALSAAGISKGMAEQWKAAEAQLATPMVQAMLTQLGLELPADFSALFGDETAVSIGAAGDQNPLLTVRTRGGDLERAKQLVTMLTTALRMDAPAAKKLADGFVLGNDKALVEGTGSGPKLADTDSYRRAVPDAEGASVVLYANVARAMAVFDAPAAEAKKLEHVDAVGFTATTDDAAPTFRLRFTTK